MPTLTITYLDRVIGKRRTDRPYTHALAVVGINAGMYRQRCIAEGERALKTYLLKNFEWSVAVAEGRSDSRYLTDREHAECKRRAALGFNGYAAEQRARVANDCEEFLARFEPHAYSWHQRPELAHTALTKAAKLHPYFDLRVLRVDQA